MNNSHRRQSSGSFSHDSVGAALHVSFASLENFMVVSKHMNDEIMVPSKLKDKTFDKETMESINSLASEVHERSTHSSATCNSHGKSLSASGNGNSGGEQNASSSSSDRFNNSEISNTSSGGEDAYSSLEYDANTSSSTTEASNGLVASLVAETEDVLDHYRFILLVRNQFLQTSPFQTNAVESSELRFKNFNRIFNNLRYHYREMMSLMDGLSDEAMAIMEIYNSNI